MNSICRIVTLFLKGRYSFCVPYICTQNGLKGSKLNFIRMRDRQYILD